MSRALTTIALLALTTGCFTGNDYVHDPKPYHPSPDWPIIGQWFRISEPVNWFVVEEDAIWCESEIEYIEIHSRYLNLDRAACGLSKLAVYSIYPSYNILDIQHWNGVYRYVRWGE